MSKAEQLVAALQAAFPEVLIQQDGNWIDLRTGTDPQPFGIIELSDAHQAYGLHYSDAHEPVGFGHKPDEVFSFAELDKLMTRIDELLADWKGPQYPDNCQACFGKSGGVRGNENRIEGLVLCDNCSVKASNGMLKSPDAPKDFEASRRHNKAIWAGVKCKAPDCYVCNKYE